MPGWFSPSSEWMMCMHPNPPSLAPLIFWDTKASAVFVSLLRTRILISSPQKGGSKLLLEELQGQSVYIDPAS